MGMCLVPGDVKVFDDSGAPVVGEPGEDIEDIQNRVADAVRWRL